MSLLRELICQLQDTTTNIYTIDKNPDVIGCEQVTDFSLGEESNSDAEEYPEENKNCGSSKQKIGNSK